MAATRRSGAPMTMQNDDWDQLPTGDASNEDDWDSLVVGDVPHGQYSPIQSAIIGVARNNPFLAEMGAAGKAGLDYLKGDETPFMDKYRSERDFIQHELDQAHEQNPKSSWTGLIGGSAINPAFKLASGLKGAALGGALMGLGESKSDLTKGELAGTALDTGLGAAGGMIGHKIGEGIAGAASNRLVQQFAREGAEDLNLSERARAVRGHIGKKFGSWFAGMPEHFSENYLQKRGKFEGPKTLDGKPILDEKGNPLPLPELDDFFNSILGEKASAEKTVSQAKDALNIAKEKLKDAIQAKKEARKDQLWAADLAVTEARNNYNNALRNFESFLGNRNLVSDQNDYVGKVGKLITLLQEEVNSLAKKGWNIIGGQRGTVSTKDIIQYINDSMARLEINPGRGRESVQITPEARAAYNELLNLRNGIMAAAPYLKLELSQAKKFLKQLWGKMDSKQGQYGSYYSGLNQVRAKAYGMLNEAVGNAVPQYRALLEGDIYNKQGGLRAKTQLLQWLSENYGDDKQIISGLSNIHSNKGQKIDVDKLGSLGRMFEEDLTTPIQDYLISKNIKTDPAVKQKFIENLPEYQTHQKMSAQKMDMLSPQSSREFQAGLEGLPEQQGKKVAEQALEEANKKLLPFDPFSLTTVQGKVKSLKGLNQFAPDAQFKALDQATGKNYTQQATDALTLNAFRKGNKHGSRNVQMYSKIPYVGKYFGGVVDEYAGPILRMIFDGSMGVVDGTAKLSGIFGKFAKPLAQAATRGPEAYAVMGAILAKDPEFRRTVEENLKNLGGR